MKTFDGKRMHPLAALLVTLRVAKEFALPFAIFLISRLAGGSGSDTHMLWRLAPGLAFVVFTAGYGTAHWLRLRYKAQQGRLLVKQGVFVTKMLDIPAERIQSIDFTEGLLQRLFGVVRVQVQTAGGKRPEAVFPALTKAEAALLSERLRRPQHAQSQAAVPAITEPQDAPEHPLAAAASGAETPGAAGSSAVFRLSPGRLVAAGMTMSSLGAAASIISFVYSLLDDIFPDLGTVLESVNAGVWPLLIAAGIAVAWFAAVCQSILRFAGFTLTVRGGELHIVRGLLERRQVTLSVGRIQAVRIVEEMLWQPFGYAAVHVETTGYGKQKGESTLLMPLMRKRDVDAFLHAAAPAFSGMQTEPERLPRSALAGYVVPLSLFWLAAALIAAWFTRWGLLGVPLAVISGAHGLWRHRDAGCRFADGRLMMRFRRLSRTTVIIPKRRAQSCRISQNPLQKRKRLSTFAVDVASSVTRVRFRLKGLSHETSEALLERMIPPLGQENARR